MIVRKIHPGEIDNLLNIIHQYAEEAAETMPEIAGEIEDSVIVENIRKWSIQHTFNLLVAFEGERPVGFIAGALVQLPYTSTPQANISFIFMTETHRTMDNFRLLLNNFENWAKTAGCKKIFSGDIGIDIERSRKLYTYLGFKEGLYVSKDLT